MKKILFGIAMISGVALTSCNTGDGENTTIIPFATCNYVVPLNGGEPSMSAGYYTVTSEMDALGATYSVSTNSLNFNNTVHSFETNKATMKVSEGLQLLTGLSSAGTQGNTYITDGTFLFSAYNVPNDFNPNNYFTPTEFDSKGNVQYVAGALYAPGYSGYYSPLIAGYKIDNNYIVRTFICDAFYSGTTYTKFNMQDGTSGTNTSQTPMYRVIIDMANKKASLVIYKVKFSNSPNEPEKPAIYLPNLDVKFVGTSYEIVGTNVVPLIPESTTTYFPNPNTFTPNPNYTFTSFRMRMTNTWLTDTQMDYKVGSNYEGTFIGSYAKLPAEMK